jgi:hypothetical protein
VEAQGGNRRDLDMFKDENIREGIGRREYENGNCKWIPSRQLSCITSTTVPEARAHIQLGVIRCRLVVSRLADFSHVAAHFVLLDLLAPLLLHAEASTARFSFSLSGDRFWPLFSAHPFYPARAHIVTSAGCGTIKPLFRSTSPRSISLYFISFHHI